ncbi:hypothetical protein WUBG_01985, partial [Wuchereria bancrofti]
MFTCWIASCIVLISIPNHFILSSCSTLESASYIVTYDGYYAANIRYNIIKQATEITVNIEPRPILLSDFDVVEVSTWNSTTFVQLVQQSIHTKCVASNNRFTAALSKKQLLSRRYSGDIEIRHVTKLLDVDKLWDMGYKG